MKSRTSQKELMARIEKLEAMVQELLMRPQSITIVAAPPAPITITPPALPATPINPFYPFTPCIGDLPPWGTVTYRTNAIGGITGISTATCDLNGRGFNSGGLQVCQNQ